MRQNLQQMVLQHVAVGAGRVIERRAISHAEILGHGDLDAAHVIAVPDRLEHRIGEARVEQVLHRLLAQEVVDAEDVLFREVLPQHEVELLGRCTVVTERLLDHQARIPSGAGLRQGRRHGTEQARRHRQVVQRPLCLAKFLVQLCERRRIGIVAVDVALAATAACPAPPDRPEPCCARLSFARSFSWSRLQPALATPMIGTSRPSSRTRPSSDGKICS